jgi:alpha-ketoglutarate-dependent taurine dioxygenase
MEFSSDQLASRKPSAHQQTSFQVEALMPGFVGRVTDVDLRAPLTVDVISNLVGACNEYGLLVFPGQPLSKAELVAFGEQFGELDSQKTKKIMTVTSSDWRDIAVMQL